MSVPAASDNAVHLARALLRECTYLPDLAARKYLRSYIIRRFRKYWPRTNPNGPWEFTKEAPTGSRQVKLFREARKGLSILQRANLGYTDCLLKVLLHTYGRTGERRHELMKPIRMPENFEDSVAVAEAAAASRDGKTDKKPFLPPKLLALAKAHRKVTLPSRLGTEIRNVSGPEIPEKNSWGRPMPAKRVRNMKRRWFAETLDKLVPALPMQEWQDLQNLASGKTKWSGPVRRRGPAPTTVFQTPKRAHPHKITPRLMRRLWTKVYTQCPVMVWDKEKSLWRVRWGLEADVHATVKPEDQPEWNFFQGVDEKGRLEGANRTIQSPTKPTRRDRKKLREAMDLSLGSSQPGYIFS